MAQIDSQNSVTLDQGSANCGLWAKFRSVFVVPIIRMLIFIFKRLKKMKRRKVFGDMYHDIQDLNISVYK